MLTACLVFIDVGGYGRNSDVPYCQSLSCGTPRDTPLQGTKHLGSMSHGSSARWSFSISMPHYEAISRKMTIKEEDMLQLRPFLCLEISGICIWNPFNSVVCVSPCPEDLPKESRLYSEGYPLSPKLYAEKWCRWQSHTTNIPYWQSNTCCWFAARHPGWIQQLKQRGCFSKKHILWLLLLTTWRVAMAKWNSSNCITLFCFM